ncbi:hypothetical protein [Parvibaculum sp.]|uniref:hypothetical protein n=1 Tax=Parvibaculum sp. TaxID=2024848 RepID=UPI00391DB430
MPLNRRSESYKICKELREVSELVEDSVRFSFLIEAYRKSQKCTQEVALKHAQEILDGFMSQPAAVQLIVDVRAPHETGLWAFRGSESRESAKWITLERGVAGDFCGGLFLQVVLKGVAAPVSFFNARIGVLNADTSDSIHLPNRSLNFTDCWIGELRIVSGCIEDLAFIRGGIFKFVCPGPAEKNPFSGSILFSNVFLPRTRKEYLIGGAQPYRNMRYHLSQLQNGPAASVFHSAELAVERDDERGLNWLFNFLYDEFSDYGASPVRPLAWIGLLWTLTTIILYWSGVDIAGEGKDAVGWQSCLHETGLWGDLLRAAILGFQPISWLGSLISSGPSVALVPHSLLAQVWLVIDGILSTVLLALFIFALRRRFRMAS